MAQEKHFHDRQVTGYAIGDTGLVGIGLQFHRQFANGVGQMTISYSSRALCLHRLCA